MSAKILKMENGRITIEIEINLDGNMLEMEEKIQKELNEVGKIATQKAIETFDTNGEEIIEGKIKYTSKGQEKKR